MRAGVTLAIRVALYPRLLTDPKRPIAVAPLDDAAVTANK
jgi:hypothetical protein